MLQKLTFYLQLGDGDLLTVAASGEVERPPLILAATDGYANSFRDETSFHQVAQDLWGMVRDEASRQGSGDDITAGLIWRHLIRPEWCKNPRQRQTVRGFRGLAESAVRFKR